MALCGMVVLFFMLTGVVRHWGLRADLYRGTEFNQLLLTTRHQTINFADALQMDPRLPPENFSVHWRGTLNAPREGRYDFSVVVDDGARLAIDNKILIDEWTDHDHARIEKGITLTPGPHKIQLDYYNHFGASFIRLSWKLPGQLKDEVIPAWQFRPDPS